MLVGELVGLEGRCHEYCADKLNNASENATKLRLVHTTKPKKSSGNIQQLGKVVELDVLLLVLLVDVRGDCHVCDQIA